MSPADQEAADYAASMAEAWLAQGEDLYVTPRDVRKLRLTTLREHLGYHGFMFVWDAEGECYWVIPGEGARQELGIPLQ